MVGQFKESLDGIRRSDQTSLYPCWRSMFFCFCGFHQTSSFAEKNVEQQKENWKIGRNYIFLLSNKTAFLVSEYECSRKWNIMSNRIMLQQSSEK